MSESEKKYSSPKLRRDSGQVRVCDLGLKPGSWLRHEVMGLANDRREPRLVCTRVPAKSMKKAVRSETDISRTSMIADVENVAMTWAIVAPWSAPIGRSARCPPKITTPCDEGAVRV